MILRDSTLSVKWLTEQINELPTLDKNNNLAVFNLNLNGYDFAVTNAYVFNKIPILSLRLVNPLDENDKCITVKDIKEKAKTWLTHDETGKPQNVHLIKEQYVDQIKKELLPEIQMEVLNILCNN